MPRSAAEAGRGLTAGERALAAGMFGRAIDYDAVHLHRRAWWPLQPRAVAMAPDGDIWFHAAGPLWSADFAAAPAWARALFVHEMTHVWQAQTRGRWYLPLMRHPFCRYGYRLVAGRPFLAYGLEQQAEIVKHGWMHRAGIAPPPGTPPRAAYEALLPFTPA